MKIVHFRGVVRADPTGVRRRKTADTPLLKHSFLIVCSRDYFVSDNRVLIIDYATSFVWPFLVFAEGMASVGCTPVVSVGISNF